MYMCVMSFEEWSFVFCKCNVGTLYPEQANIATLQLQICKSRFVNCSFSSALPHFYTCNPRRAFSFITRNSHYVNATCIIRNSTFFFTNSIMLALKSYYASFVLSLQMALLSRLSLKRNIR